MSYSDSFAVAFAHNGPLTDSGPSIERTNSEPLGSKRAFPNNRIEEKVAHVFCNYCKKQATNKITCKSCKKINYCTDKCEHLDVLHKMVCIEISTEKEPIKIIIVRPKKVNTNSDVLQSDIKDDDNDYSEIISEIEKQTLNKTFSNIPYYFQCESDPLKPLNRLRVICNPLQQPFTNSRTRNQSKINPSIMLAYDKCVPNVLIDQISKKFNISIKLGNNVPVKDENSVIRDQSPVDIYAPKNINLSDSKS